ncbi:MAG: hypothetical protein ACO25K_06335, partial [Candidatus Fonsibacter ubiquis]
TMFLSVKTIKNKNITENEEIGLGVLITTFTFVISLLTYQIIDSIDEANKIKAKIILMKPLDLYKKDIAIAEKELMKVERYIERAFDKNNPNISVDLKDGVKFYSILGNSDFGSAEMGNAKKQELLLNYIDKQNELAEKLIFIRKMAYGGDEYYQLQQEYAVYANSIFSGLFVRWFSMKENYSGVVNNVIYAK